MGKASCFARLAVPALTLTLCSVMPAWSGSGNGEQPASDKKGEDRKTAGRSAAVASVALPGGHRVDFFAPPGGPIAIAEVGARGTPRVVDEETVTHKKASEIFLMLKGKGAVLPPALVEAEERIRAMAAKSRPAPDRKEGAAGKGPDDTADQMWFKATFCKPVWECIQGWSWANTSWGHNTGRGYAADAMNGSEARGARTLETDWWNGSNWASLITESMPPGWWAWTTAGNLGAPTCHDQTWYFKSEVPDNGTGDFATVSLADHMYAPGFPGTQTVRMSCYECPGNCDCGCDGCPTGRGGGNNFLCHQPTTCPDDSCVNPP
jgi:hypothetical protein